MKKCALRAIGIYTALTAYQGFARRKHEDNFWLDAVKSIQIQWGLAKNLTQATGAFVSPNHETVLAVDAKVVEEKVADSNAVEESAVVSLQD